MHSWGYFKAVMRQHLLSWKTVAVVLISTLCMDGYLSSIRRYCECEGEQISPWGMPLIWDKQYVSVIFFLIFLFAISDFPLDRAKSKYVICRIGSVRWIRIQQMCLIACSFLYMILLFVIQQVLLAPVTVLTMDWGSGWERLTDTSMRDKYEMVVQIPKEKIFNQSTLAMNAKYLLLLFLILVSIAELALWLNLHQKLISALISGLLVIIPLSGKLTGRAFYILPTTWMQQKALYSVYQPNQPTMGYMYLFLLLEIILLLLCGMERCSTTQENNRRKY